MANSAPDLIAAVAERISTLLGPRAMRMVARFNKYVTNPIQRMWAPYLPCTAVSPPANSPAAYGWPARPTR